MNCSKSNMFLSGIPPEEKIKLSVSMNLEVGELPFKYLGVPITSSKLKRSDCKLLIHKIVGRINSWRNKFLSYAGRLLLIKAVLFSIQVYWSSIFILPSSVHKEIDGILRNFLWSGAAMDWKKAKVAWDEVCVPKVEGGLGIMRCKAWNKAAIIKNMWKILLDKGNSLWVEWIKANRLRGKSFWEIKPNSESS